MAYIIALTGMTNAVEAAAPISSKIMAWDFVVDLSVSTLVVVGTLWMAYSQHRARGNTHDGDEKMSRGAKR